MGQPKASEDAAVNAHVKGLARMMSPPWKLPEFVFLSAGRRREYGADRNELPHPITLKIA
jgi:hypothetical protein